MENHLELSDAEFERQFSCCELPLSLLSHEAHLRIAWIYIRQYGIEQAKKEINGQLRKFVEFNGAKGKFHKTLTIAAVLMIDNFMKRSKSNTFTDFILKFPKLKTDFKKLIASHYSFDIFNSVEARAEYLEPDLLPFD